LLILILIIILIIIITTIVISLVHEDKVVSMSEGVGPIIKKLYTRIRQIQTGEGEDKFNWMMEL